MYAEMVRKMCSPCGVSRLRRTELWRELSQAASNRKPVLEGGGGVGRGMSIKQEHTQCYSNTLCRPALSSPVCIIHLEVLGFEEVEGQHVGLVV